MHYGGSLIHPRDPQNFTVKLRTGSPKFYDTGSSPVIKATPTTTTTPILKSDLECMHGMSWANIQAQSIQTSFAMIQKTSVHHL
jgi:hypothetical protein